MLRSRIIYDNKEIAKNDINEHIKNSTDMLSNCDIFFIILGMTETWKYKNLILPNYPKYYNLDKDISFYNSNFNDNPCFLRNLRINLRQKFEKKSTKDSSKKFSEKF